MKSANWFIYATLSREKRKRVELAALIISRFVTEVFSITCALFMEYIARYSAVCAMVIISLCSLKPAYGWHPDFSTLCLAIDYYQEQ